MQQRTEVIRAQRAIAAEDQTIVGLLVMLHGLDRDVAKRLMT